MRPLRVRPACSPHARRPLIDGWGVCTTRHLSLSPKSKVAVLYQALKPPIIDGIKKPKKPNGELQTCLHLHITQRLTQVTGYRDSGADIGYNLSHVDGVEVITPVERPDPTVDSDWSFPDTEDGILEAINRGATHLWSNTIVFASHPLQISARIGKYSESIQVVGQSPLHVDKYDNKDVVNKLLRESGGFTMPRAWSVPSRNTYSASDFTDLPFPIVSKPIRGRGSYGVKVCRSAEELAFHVQKLRDESASAMLEEFLSGEEGTVTVMPPTAEKKGYWALPVVSRFNHDDGIAPYNGIIAVTANSRAVPDSATNPIYAQYVPFRYIYHPSDWNKCADRYLPRRVMRDSERAAALLGVTAPIRIDVRRVSDLPESTFALFDLNMKPVSGKEALYQ
jgi:hypothetical protein